MSKQEKTEENKRKTEIENLKLKSSKIVVDNVF